jgi:long-subunit acyl-CoA synthetase (AMP-forming)
MGPDNRAMHTESLIRPSSGDDVTAGLPTICAAFQATAARYPNRIALRFPEAGIAWSWDEYAARVRSAATTLHSLGVRRHDAVALLLPNRPEHLLADLAAAHLGTVPFSIYATSAPPQVEYILRHSAARVLITETRFDDTVAAVAPRCPDLQHVLRLSPGAPELAGVEAPAFDFEQSWRAVAPHDPVCLIYTSGTTGPPKAAEITHAGLLAGLRGTWRLLPVPEQLRSVSFLPLAHVMERSTSHYSAIVLAGTITCCPDPAGLPGALADCRPTFLVAPPRVWEKLRARCQALHAHPPSFVQAAGLAELEIACTGGAPLPMPMLEHFQAAGVPLRQAWGMTEICGPGTITTSDPADNGTCGRAIDGLELSIASDGEVLARGPMVIRRYRNPPHQTAETTDAGGWFHTGDLGRLDEKGRLKIIDRKKELIINSAGKNMSPANIEAELVSATPLLGQACAIGNARPYNVALLVLDPEIAGAYPDHSARAREIAHGVKAANARLSRAEQIKRYTILNAGWLPCGDELTPTLKLKRKAIEQKYGSQIEEMYARPETEASLTRSVE